MLIELPQRVARQARTMDLVDLDRLSGYLALYRDLFARADQARSFELYVRGLLGTDYRKNVEGIADRVQDGEGGFSNLAQSLHHFVSQSPWSAEVAMQRFRTQLPLSDSSERCWVVHDGIIPKKGSHSVGAHRQFSRALGRKMNCQMSVVISEVAVDVVPLALRLYLPAHWLRRHEGRAGRMVPDPFQISLSRPEIALALVDELRADRAPAPIFAEESYHLSDEFRDGLHARGISLAHAPISNPLDLARAKFEWLKETLGLGHFEGRTWNGWHHHAALVLVALGYLLQQDK